MATVLCDISALNYWRSCDGGYPEATRSRLKLVGDRRAADLVERCVPTSSDLGKPLRILVASAEDRVRTADVTSIVHASPLPACALCPLGESLYVCSPEMTFVEMGRRLTEINLIRYGFEICGSYAIRPQVEAGFVRRDPLTNASKLAAFVEDASRVPGSKRARSAVRHIIDASASPMETIVALLLCLPVRMGGYGIPQPTMNAKVSVAPGSSFESGTRYCDLLWKGARFALEYDSRAYHSSEEKQWADSKRRAELGDAGVSVVSVAARQVYDAGEFERIARIVSRATRKRIDGRAFRPLRQRDELRTKLLGA